MSKAHYKTRQQVVGSFPVASPFCRGDIRASAAIEFISFRIPYDLTIAAALDTAMSTAFAEGRLKRPQKHEHDWLTLHDPTRSDMQALVSAHPNGEMLGIEIRVDFSPVLPSVPPTWYTDVRTYLRHAICPNGHPLFQKAVRWRYDPVTKKTKKDLLGGRVRDGTLYIQNTAQYAFLRIYPKGPLVDGSPDDLVRVEIKLDRGGCQLHALLALASLPSFFKRLRRGIGAAFFVARGAKFNPRSTKSKRPALRAAVDAANRTQRRNIETGFTKWGAMWCAKKRIPLAPDPTATRLIGSALQRLSRSHKKLTIDPKKRKQIQAHLDHLAESFLVVSHD
jgi:hypothetical protein